MLPMQMNKIERSSGAVIGQTPVRVVRRAHPTPSRKASGSSARTGTHHQSARAQCAHFTILGHLASRFSAKARSAALIMMVRQRMPMTSMPCARRW